MFTLKHVTRDGTREVMGTYDEWLDAWSVVADSFFRTELIIEQRDFESNSVHTFYFDYGARIASVAHDCENGPHCKYDDLELLNR